MTIIRIVPYGRMANQMMQLMFALAVKRKARTPIVIEGYDLPSWGLRRAATLSDRYSVFAVSYGTTKASMVASVIDRYKPRQIDLSSHIPRLGNLLPKFEYESWFPIGAYEGVPTAATELLIHIRLGDVATPTHPAYGPLSISYYRYLVDRNGLSPVFIGELDQSSYCNALRNAFPEARFLPMGTPREDFQTIRRAHNIALSVGTFSWVAAYLSTAKSVHLPVCGIFDYRERPQIDLLPIGDTRFTFYRIPYGIWEGRYSDFHAEGEFKVLSTWQIKRSRSLAALKTSVRRGRIRLGIERRAFLSALARDKLFRH